MTGLTHFVVSDVDAILRRADAGDESAKRAVTDNAHDWLMRLLATVATDRTVLHRLEAAFARLPITAEQVSKANALIEQFAPAAESTTAVQVALGALQQWIQTNGEYPRPA